MPKPLIAVGQMTSTDDVEENLRACERLAAQAAARGAAMLCLPENFAFLGRSDVETRARMEPLDGPLFSACAELARRHRLWMSFGGFPEAGPTGDDGVARAYNAHVIVDDTGAVRANYHKVHLFDVNLSASSSYRESKAIAPGDRLVTTSSPVGALGLAVCYDLRFPELFRALARDGARVLLVPAAFTLQTGKEHWEVLLRARAVENQCYVVAAAQTGRHNDKRDTFGHAMIIDPWGTVIAQCRDGEGIALAEIDDAWIDTVRQRIPVWEHRRTDVYGR